MSQPHEKASPWAIVAEGLHKRFGPCQALKGLSLHVPAGAFYALLGPNGAGKSTSLALLNGVLQPDAGSICILGMDARQHPLEVKRCLGAVPEELALFERLTSRQQLLFSARMFGLGGQEAQRRAEELLELLELSHKAHDLVASLSKGMRRRLAIASALIHSPRLVLLDEPFEGIDIMAGEMIRRLLLGLSKQGVSILMTTHVLEIAEKMASHVGILVEGHMAIEGPIEPLKEQHKAPSLEALFFQALPKPKTASLALSFFNQGEEGGVR
ncbi:MAG: ABC transporter ATP-binding protein [Cystobacterineae bacterium]|nr:ABC transporter ATP-binding protein [Cystobacterineae bacterium]